MNPEKFRAVVVKLEAIYTDQLVVLKRTPRLHSLMTLASELGTYVEDRQARQYLQEFLDLLCLLARSGREITIEQYRENVRMLEWIATAPTSAPAAGRGATS